MNDKKEEPQDPAEVLKRRFSSFQAPASTEPRRYMMSARNQKRLDRIRLRVRQMRGQ